MYPLHPKNAVFGSRRKTFQSKKRFTLHINAAENLIFKQSCLRQLSIYLSTK